MVCLLHSCRRVGRWFFGQQLGRWQKTDGYDSPLDQNSLFVTIVGLGGGQTLLLLITEDNLFVRPWRIVLFAFGLLLNVLLIAGILGTRIEGTDFCALSNSSRRFGNMTQVFTLFTLVVFGVLAALGFVQQKESVIDQISVSSYTYSAAEIGQDQKDGILIGFRINGTRFRNGILPTNIRVRASLPDSIHDSYEVTQLLLFDTRSSNLQRNVTDQVADVKVYEFVAPSAGSIPDEVTGTDEEKQTRQLSNYKYYLIYDTKSDMYYGAIYLMRRIPIDPSQTNDDFVYQLKSKIKQIKIDAFEIRDFQSKVAIPE